MAGPQMATCSKSERNTAAPLLDEPVLLPRFAGATRIWSGYLHSTSNNNHFQFLFVCERERENGRVPGSEQVPGLGEVLWQRRRVPPRPASGLEHLIPVLIA
jgi:hypothetical protein